MTVSPVVAFFLGVMVGVLLMCFAVACHRGD